MDPLNVYIESDGKERKIGTIVGRGTKDAVFSYADEWLSDDHAVPVSLSLPLRKEAFSPEETRNYFEGLLPEGFTRRSVADWLHADAEDYITILEGLGHECLVLKVPGPVNFRNDSYSSQYLTPMSPVPGKDIMNGCRFTLSSGMRDIEKMGKIW